MITRDEVLKIADGLEGAVTDCPFKDDFYSTVLRHGKNKKWFGLLFKAPASFFARYGAEPFQEGEILNLKCPADLQEFLRSKYPRGVLPAYHMNKTHWISVVLRSEITPADAAELIKLSYEITLK